MQGRWSARPKGLTAARPLSSIQHSALALWHTCNPAALPPHSNASAVSLRSNDLFTFLPTVLFTSSPDHGSPAYESPGFLCVLVDSTFLIAHPFVLQPVAPAQRAIVLTILHFMSALNLTCHSRSSYSPCSLSLPTNFFEGLHTRFLPQAFPVLPFSIV